MECCGGVAFGLLAALSVSGLVLAPAHVEAAKMLTDHGDHHHHHHHHLAVLLGLLQKAKSFFFQKEKRRRTTASSTWAEMAQGSQGLSFALVSRGTVVLAEHA